MRIDRTKLVVAMMARDISAVQLAARTGISRYTISAVKNGKRCSEDTAIRIARGLDMPVEELLEGVS